MHSTFYIFHSVMYPMQVRLVLWTTLTGKLIRSTSYPLDSYDLLGILGSTWKAVARTPKTTVTPLPLLRLGHELGSWRDISYQPTSNLWTFVDRWQMDSERRCVERGD